MKYKLIFFATSFLQHVYTYFLQHQSKTVYTLYMRIQNLFAHISERYAIQPIHDDAIKWKHFPRYWPFVWGNRRSPVHSPHKGQWRRVLVFYLICAWTNSWSNTGDAGDLRRHRANHDVTVMLLESRSNLAAVLLIGNVFLHNPARSLEVMLSEDKIRPLE